MKYKFEIATVALTWILFASWEYYVHQWAKDITEPIIRVDLVVLLPILFVLTIFMITHIIRKNKTTN